MVSSCPAPALFQISPLDLSPCYRLIEISKGRLEKRRGALKAYGPRGAEWKDRGDPAKSGLAVVGIPKSPSSGMFAILVLQLPSRTSLGD